MEEHGMEELALKRRQLLDLVGAAALSQLVGCAAEPVAADALGLTQAPLEQHIALLVYPEMTLLDLVGPQTCFSALGMTMHLVWKTLAPITTESGIVILPTTTFEQCPLDLEILFIPGSTFGATPLVRDQQVLDFVRSRGERAKLVTSVCTGSLVLGAAGLLRGYKATSHWFTRELLPEAEAIRVDARYVEDRNRITGAGVTSGIDFGLRIVDRLSGREIAEMTQLLMEYAPEPPFNAGEPTTAPPLAVDTIRTLFGLALIDGRLAMQEAAAKF
jgi:cyclohexyl-isocyanide hydratase